jgi:hypothetical protein
MTLAHSTLGNGHGAMATQPWLKESVRAFFEGVAWTGQATPAAGASGTSPGDDAGGSLMTMTVSRFFDTISWEGKPTIGVPIAPVEAQPDPEPTEDSITLDGISDLFG